MSYLRKMLLPDERIVLVASLHWVIYLPGLVLSLIGGLIGHFCYDLSGFMIDDEKWAMLVGRILAGLSMAVGGTGFLLLLAAAVRQTATELAITNKRIIAKYGFISRSTFEIMMNRITGANFDQTITGRILGYGTILVRGTGGDVSPFDIISHPQRFQRVLMHVLQKEVRR